MIVVVLEWCESNIIFKAFKEKQIQVKKDIFSQYRNSEIECKSREFPLYFHIILC